MLPGSGLSPLCRKGCTEGYIVEKTFINFVDTSPSPDAAQGLRRVCSDGAIYENSNQKVDTGQSLSDRSLVSETVGVEYELTGLSDWETGREDRTSLRVACQQYFQKAKQGDVQIHGSVTGSTCSASSHEGTEASELGPARVIEREHLIAENARLALENDLLRENMRLAMENAKLKAAATTNQKTEHRLVAPCEILPVAQVPAVKIAPRVEINKCHSSGVASVDERTTVMWRNLPNNYTRSMFLSLLDSAGFGRLYDFVYLPIDFKTGACLGYAFINLVNESVVHAFWTAFDGYARWDIPSKKASYVSWSEPHQGFVINVERYRNSPVMHDSVPDEYKPAVFVNGVRMAFPGPTKTVRAPRARESANTHKKGR